MARSRRPLAAGLIYHVTARGNAKAPTFLTDADYEVFLSGLTVARHLDGLLCHAYCLMENHYHLLVETPRANLDDAMHRLNGTYAIRFNRHHERTGHVFQGRYGAKLITDDNYALTVVRYIAANPVQAGLCAAPEEWPWSSYAATAGLASPPTIPHIARRRLVRRPRGVPSVSSRPGSTTHRSSTDRRCGELVPTSDPELIAAAHRTHGYWLAEIADHLGVHRSTVWRAFAAESQRATLVPDPVFAPVQEAGVSMHFENTPATWA